MPHRSSTEALRSRRFQQIAVYGGLKNVIAQPQSQYHQISTCSLGGAARHGRRIYMCEIVLQRSESDIGRDVKFNQFQRVCKASCKHEFALLNRHNSVVHPLPSTYHVSCLFQTSAESSALIARKPPPNAFPPAANPSLLASCFSRGFEPRQTTHFVWAPYETNLLGFWFQLHTVKTHVVFPCGGVSLRSAHASANIAMAWRPKAGGMG